MGSRIFISIFFQKISSCCILEGKPLLVKLIVLEFLPRGKILWALVERNLNSMQIREIPVRFISRNHLRKYYYHVIENLRRDQNRFNSKANSFHEHSFRPKRVFLGSCRINLVLSGHIFVIKVLFYKNYFLFISIIYQAIHVFNTAYNFSHQFLKYSNADKTKWIIMVNGNAGFKSLRLVESDPMQILILHSVFLKCNSRNYVIKILHFHFTGSTHRP